MSKRDMTARGRVGEEAVCRFLEGHGCTILARNYKAAHGELDIVAESAHYLLFVEVKARRCRAVDTASLQSHRPAAAVTAAKQQHMISAAEAYLAKHPHEKPPRLDVAEVYISADIYPAVLHIQYLPGAFTKS